MIPLVRVSTRAVFAAFVCVGASGCVPPLNDCELNGYPGLVLDLEECPADCYEDLDGDGWGGDLGDLDNDGVCDEGEVTQGNDCDDLDAGAFPGNVEVCDGLDNDCNGDSDFDVEGEEEEEGQEGSFVFSCSPHAVPIHLFLLGGSEIAGQRIDATTSDIKINTGQTLTGKIRLRSVVPAGNESSIAGGLSASWPDSHEASFRPFWEPVVDPDGQPDPGRTDWEYEFVDFPTPAGGDDTTQYLTLAAGLAPKAEYVGSLTNPFYCYPPGEGGPEVELCPASWDGVESEGGPQTEADRDVADLDELDLAGCRAFGAARMPVLVEAVDPAGQPCSVEDDGPQPCHGVYAPVSIGCLSIQMLIEEGEE